MNFVGTGVTQEASLLVTRLFTHKHQYDILVRFINELNSC